jgi:hypothetical protein
MDKNPRVSFEAITSLTKGAWQRLATAQITTYSREDADQDVRTRCLCSRVCVCVCVCAAFAR